MLRWFIKCQLYSLKENIKCNVREIFSKDFASGRVYAALLKIIKECFWNKGIFFAFSLYVFFFFTLQVCT